MASGQGSRAIRSLRVANGPYLGSAPPSRMPGGRIPAEAALPARRFRLTPASYRFAKSVQLILWEVPMTRVKDFVLLVLC